MFSLCPWQGGNILKELEELPSRNVTVRVITSVPTVRTNSTDLQILKQKGLLSLQQSLVGHQLFAPA